MMLESRPPERKTPTGTSARLGGVLDALPGLARELFVAAGVGGRRVDRLPVALDLQLAVFKDGGRGWRQLLDSLEHGQGRRDVAGAQVEIQRLVVELARNGSVLQQRLDLAAEAEALLAEVIVEWLLAEAVAGEEEPLLARVPDGEGEHAGEALGQRVAPLLVAVNQDLGVAARPEGMPAGDQLVAQPEIIINLAIEGNGDGAVLVVHRLRAVHGQVDDGEAPMPQRNRALDERAAAVGAAVGDDVGHALEQRRVRRTFTVAIYEAADAAHGAASLDGRSSTAASATGSA